MSLTLLCLVINFAILIFVSIRFRKYYSVTTITAATYTKLTNWMTGKQYIPRKLAVNHNITTKQNQQHGLKSAKLQPTLYKCDLLNPLMKSKRVTVHNNEGYCAVISSSAGLDVHVSYFTTVHVFVFQYYKIFFSWNHMISDTVEVTGLKRTNSTRLNKWFYLLLCFPLH